MKYVLLLPLLTVGNLFTMHAEYTLPLSETITKRLWDTGFNHFAKESQIGTLLGNTPQSPILLSVRVDDLLKKYKENCPRQITFDEIMKPHLLPKTPGKSDLMRILLKDYPRAIEALENNYNGAFIN